MSFLLGSFITIAAFAQMYYITNNFVIGTCTSPMFYVQDQDFTCTLRDTYFMTFSSIITGHWRFMEQPSNSPMTAISFALAVFTILLLFTSLIGQIISMNKTIQEKAVTSFWVNRLYIIVEISDFNETFGCGCCRKDIADGDIASRWANGTKHSDVPTTRFLFSKAEKYKSFPEDDDKMRDWWIGEEERVPSLSRRIRYFMNWAPLSEIMVPGRELERAIGGHEKDAESYLIRLLTYILCPLYLSLVLFIFALGLFSAGLLWPREMRKRIFCGDESLGREQKKKALDARIDVVKNGVDAVKAEMKASHMAFDALEDDVHKLQSTLNDVKKLLKAMGDDSSTNVGSSSYLEELYESEY